MEDTLAELTNSYPWDYIQTVTKFESSGHGSDTLLSSSSPSSSSISVDSGSSSDDFIRLVMNLAMSDDNEEPSGFLKVLETSGIRDKDVSLLPTVELSVPTSMFIQPPDEMNVIDSAITMMKTNLELTNLNSTIFNFFTYSAMGPPGAGVFILEGRNKLIQFEPSHFSVLVTSPSGLRPTIYLTQDEFRTSFIFKVVESGFYRVSICLAQLGYQHVEGSPFTMELLISPPGFGVDIGNNFGIGVDPSSFFRPNVTSGPIYGIKGVIEFERSKLWGISASIQTGYVYAADRYNHEVMVFSVQPDQLVLEKKFGLKQTEEFPERFLPTGIACDDAKMRVLVTDKGNHRVCIFTVTGEFINSFGSRGYQNGQLCFPWGIAVTPNGNYIAICDSRNHRIQLFNENGDYIRKFTIFEQNPFEFKNQFDSPRGICFDNTGTKLYVTDFNIHNVFEFDIELQTKRTICPGGKLFRPQGLTVGPFGHLFVCDSRNSTIRIIDTHGNLVYSIQNTNFMDIVVPLDITVCRGGYICISDNAGGRLRIF